MRRIVALTVPLAILSLVPVSAVKFSMPAAPRLQSTGQDTKPLKDAVDKLGERFKEMETNKQNALRRIEDSKCKADFNRTMDEYGLIRKDALQSFSDISSESERLISSIRPVPNLAAEETKMRESLDELRSQSQSLNDELVALRQSISTGERRLFMLREKQRDVVRDWLLDEYGNKEGSTRIVNIGTQCRVVTTNTLFGTFSAGYEHELKEQRSITVTFEPAIFSNDLFATGLELAPVDYSPQPPSTMNFTAATVSGDGSDHPFKLQERIPINPQKSISWTWNAVASKGFDSADFRILMNAFRANGNKAGAEVTVARLPVQLQRPSLRPWYERIAPLMGPTIGVLVGLFLGRIPEIYRYSKGRRQAGFTGK